MTTAEDICHGIPKKKLDSPISDIHIADLAFMLTTWEELAPYLGLTEAEEEAIREDYQGRYGLQKRQALRKWKSKLGSGRKKGATYRNLIIALCRIKETEMAKKISNLLIQPEESATSTSDHVLDTFYKYLVDCYTRTKHPSQTQWPTQQPLSRLSSYIDLTLVQAPDTQMPQYGQGESQATPQPLKEVQLGELFHVGSHHAKRKVVLIEGPAGCGKTTLSWHVCQEWAAGRLFQQFSLLIYVSLEDDTLLSAKCLADIIPHGSSKLREAVAEAIFEQDGKGVCFLFDAWDEAPRALLGKKSYLFKFITGTSTRKLTHCSVVVLSRPTVASLLYCHLTLHVNVRGFGATKVEEFIHASLDDQDSRQKLLQQLRENPQVNDLCNLPINAAIVVHLFRSHLSLPSHFTLPSTRTGIFKALVCNLLLRYMQLRTKHGLLEVREFKNLPGDVLRDFYSVCDLAVTGVMNDKKVFHLDSLKEVKLAYSSSPLDLMQVQQQLTGFGARHCYSFLHYVVQEFLAAYYISKFYSKKEQIKVVGDILHSTPLSTVLPFYAGLTKLLDKGTRDILLRVTKDPLDTYSVTTALMQCNMTQSRDKQRNMTQSRDKQRNMTQSRDKQRNMTQSRDKRRLLLSLLNCIYESQRPSICKLVKPPCGPAKYTIHKDMFPSSIPSSNKKECYISFACLGLDPVDCLSIGYFIRHASTQLPIVNVDVQQCCISDTEIEILAKCIGQMRSEPRTYLQIDYNIMSHGAIKSLSNTLKCPFSALIGISLTGCWHPAITDIKSSLKYLIEGVSRNTSLVTLALEECFLGPAHAYHLALLAAVGNIKVFDLSSNNVRSAIPFIAKITKHERLNLLKCCITDKELNLLGEALQQNDTVMGLIISGNLFSSDALTLFLKGLIESKSILIKLAVDKDLSDEQNSIIETINRNRKQKPCTPAPIICGRPFHYTPALEVTSMISTSKLGAVMTHTLRTIPPDLRTREGIRKEDLWQEESAQPIHSLGSRQ